METTKGEIYFIREMESGSFTAHTKIGLIGDKKDRSSSDRMSEHQTGNPRKLVISHVVVTDCVRAVETYMHRKYASLRGLGEWFQLDEGSLAEAISFCEQLAARFAMEVEVLEQSKALKDQVSIGVFGDASAEASKWFKKLVSSSALIRECDSLERKYKEVIRDAESSGEDTTRNAEVQTADRNLFNEKGFKEKYETIWRLYAQEVSTISGKFVIEKVKMDEADNVESNPEFESLKGRFLVALASSESHSVKLEAAKGCYLELIGFGKEAKVEKDIAEAHLKVLCGTSDGISGICKWKRTEKLSFALDKKSLEAHHPTEFKEFLVAKTIERMVTEKAQGAAQSSPQINSGL
jgi:hypothetical protein